MELKLDGFKPLAAKLAFICIQAYHLYLYNRKFILPNGYKTVGLFKANAFGVNEWFGFILESPGDIVVAFRGTVSAPDWKADLLYAQTRYKYYLFGGKVHTGFQSIYSSCRNYINQVLLRLHPNKRLYITGHSLGGALSTLCALDIAVNNKFRRPVMINFGAPRVGDPRFAVAYNNILKSSVRVVNTHDIFTKLPPKEIHSPDKKMLWHYSHVGKSFPMSFQSGNITGNHDIHNYLRAIQSL